MLFAKTKDGELPLCVDYQAFNLGTINNSNPLILITELLDRLHEALIFTELDIRIAYHFIHIKEGNEFKSAFQTRDGMFEYRVMPFRLTHAPATLQAYLDDCLRRYINEFTMCYFHNILIYSTNQKEHEDHV
jgi:hypothetical protein